MASESSGWGSSCQPVLGARIVSEPAAEQVVQGAPCVLVVLSASLIHSFTHHITSHNPEPHDVIKHSPTAGLLRPAFVIFKERASHTIILCVRGTHSRSDMFTSLTGACVTQMPEQKQSAYINTFEYAGLAWALVRVLCLCWSRSLPCVVCLHALTLVTPLLSPRTHLCANTHTWSSGTVKPHHVVTPDGVALGYSHLGMLAAARWLLTQTKATLIEALQQHPGYNLRIVGECRTHQTESVWSVWRESALYCKSCWRGGADVVCTTHWGGPACSV